MHPCALPHLLPDRHTFILTGTLSMLALMHDYDWRIPYGRAEPFPLLCSGSVKHVAYKHGTGQPYVRARGQPAAYHVASCHRKTPCQRQQKPL
eukprot:140458-Pelagomonas_calceolata.AAC.5